MKDKTKTFLLAFSSFFCLGCLYGLFRQLKNLRFLIENSDANYRNDTMFLIILSLISIFVLIEIGKPGFIERLTDHIPGDSIRSILKSVLQFRTHYGDEILLVVLLICIPIVILFLGFNNYNFIQKYLEPVDISYTIEENPDASISLNTINTIDEKAHTCFKSFIDVLITPTYHDTLFDKYSNLDKFEVEALKREVVDIRRKFPELSAKVRKEVSEKSDGIFVVEGNYSKDEGNTIILDVDVAKYFHVNEVNELTLTFYDGDLNSIELE